ncbi:acyl-CoA dehydrogenase/oxidase [Roridomyces roridus]|uniref:Acyl-CoA dehydrogenase/oxidase n=1 Tax=Roridomyces roridus TaxID=1738132 RepID=A0AAD7CJD3_9AGAR|nr:acyl-CoA dehydrogenase/oxidase [Roridomyces roridus]
MAMKAFSKDAVAQHNKPGDLWVAIDSKVYDVSKFAQMHPGGLAVLLDEEVAGQDATELFCQLHRMEVLDRYKHLQIGTIAGEEPQLHGHIPGTLSLVPYAEPTWLTRGYHTPYYKDHHRRFQAAVRRFVEQVVYKDAQAKERGGGKPSQEVFDELARLNIVAMHVGAGKHLEGRQLMDGIISVEEFDVFHELILNQEFTRLHARGYEDGLAGGTIIGLPPVIRFAEPALRDKLIEETLSCKKLICLAVTEAWAGSDVQGIKTRATRTPEGWIVNGAKKWITNAMFAHYFTVACKQDNGEIIVLVVERGEGVETRPIQTAYSSSSAGTAYVTFDNVKVPHGNRLGAGHPGLHIILANFNHERWVLVSANISWQRIIYEECFKWANQRKIFGKPLVSQAVVRQKLAAMISRFESCQSWLENITFQMMRMNAKEEAQHLAGQIAFLKMHATRASQETAKDAVQIFGGRGLTQTGMGRFIEHFHRTLLIDAVISVLTAFTAEDVLGDLGVRQALRSMPARARL